MFSNWIPFRRQIEQLGLVQHKNVIVDLSDTKLVDHSVMDKLAEMADNFEQEGLTLQIIGLDTHQQLSQHERAARKRGLAIIRRITVTADAALEQWLEEEFVKLGATGYTVVPCSGVGRRHVAENERPHNSQVRIEVIVPVDACERILEFLRKQILPTQHVTACIETVDVLRSGQFETDCTPHIAGVASTASQADHGG